MTQKELDHYFEVKSIPVTSVIVKPVLKGEEEKYKALMQQHHYLGFVPKIGETIWYVTTIDKE